MPLNKQLKDFIQTQVPAVWIDTTDSIGAQLELQLLAHEMPMTFIAWDLVRGVAMPHPPHACVGDPVGAAGLGSQHRISGQPTVLLLHNYHWYLNRVEVVQALLNAIGNARAIATTIMIAAPRVSLPHELESHFRFLDPGLPAAEEIREIAEPLLEGSDAPCQEVDTLEALSGLTCLEIRNIIELVRRKTRYDRPQAILARKAEVLARHTLLRRQYSQDTLGTIYGMPYLNEHCLKALPVGYPAASRGLFLLGPSGCGKTAFGLALGNELGRPVYTLDWPKLGTGAVPPEKELRDSLSRLEAMAPAILLLDEISTYIVRMASVLDGSRPTRIWATLVEWMTTHQADVFTIATGNAVGNVPVELLHAERLESVFFIDLPDGEVRERLWEKFRAEFQISEQDTPPNAVGWSGGEIRACCRRAAHQGCSLNQAAASAIPISTVSAEPLEMLRMWASGRSRSVEGPETYIHVPKWVNRRFIDPSMN